MGCRNLVACLLNSFYYNIHYFSSKTMLAITLLHYSNIKLLDVLVIHSGITHAVAGHNITAFMIYSIVKV